MFILLGNSDEGLHMGKIMLVIVAHNSVHFVSEKHTSVKLSDIGVHCDLGVTQEDYVCIKHEDLLDYYPLPAYNISSLNREEREDMRDGEEREDMRDVGTDLGVESIEDLALMEEKDLVRYLKPIQCRKLMNGIKEGFLTINMEVLPPHPIASSSPTSSSANTLASPQAFRPPHHLLSSPPSTSSSSQSSQPGMPWHVDFRVNWNQMPTAIQRAVEKEERPMPDERRAFVNALVDQMMQPERNPTRAMCHSIVRTIVRSHPKSLVKLLETDAPLFSNKLKQEWSIKPGTTLWLDAAEAEREDGTLEWQESPD
ncbi:hypothetical protein NQZ68_000963 [Dissostichus eleginoides]|nr:hypothetical protein NQZ68_000963 [Dissostichus eleginoides]